MLKHISKVSVKFFPFAADNTTTARTFFAMVKNDKATASNEAAECSMEVLKKYEPASISIEWEDKTKMLIDTSKKTLPDVMRLVDMKRREMVLVKTMKDMRAEWEPEMDPFEEARLEAEKRHADRARKAAGAAKKKAA